MPPAKDEMTLVSHYEKKFKEHYDFKPSLNRHKVKWAFRDMLTDMGGLDEAIRVIDFYFTTVGGPSSDHSLDFLLYNYEKINESRLRDEAQVKELARLREASRIRAERWKETHGKQ